VPGQRRHSGARAAQRNLAQHFLTSPRLARELVERAGVDAGDRVVDLGAGRGVLTEAIAARAAHVLAVEIDDALVRELVCRFAANPTVTVVRADASGLPLPATPFRVLANVPFNHTSTILRRLVDPNGGLTRADLVVQWQAARARAQAGVGRASDLLGATWAPWWTFARGRRLPASLFRPSPSVDAAMLVITRRADPLLPADRFSAYSAFVREAFARDGAAAEVGVDEWVSRYRGCVPRD
jgi:23S rRNA (adenine-N6)-dimethyltransferase